jgi:hypothetical protein
LVKAQTYLKTLNISLLEVEKRTLQINTDTVRDGIYQVVAWLPALVAPVTTKFNSISLIFDRSSDAKTAKRIIEILLERDFDSIEKPSSPIQFEALPP